MDTYPLGSKSTLQASQRERKPNLEQTLHTTHTSDMSNIPSPHSTILSSLSLSLSLPKFPPFPRVSPCNTIKPPEIYNFAKPRTSSSPSADGDGDDLATSSKLHHASSPSSRPPSVWLNLSTPWLRRICLLFELAKLATWVKKLPSPRFRVQSKRKRKRAGERRAFFPFVGWQAGRQGHLLYS